MPEANQITIKTNKHELVQAANWLLFVYAPRTAETIATGPRDKSLVEKDKQFAKELGEQLLKSSKRKREKKVFSIAIDKELVNWFAELASVDLFRGRVMTVERNRRYVRGVPEFSFTCLNMTFRHRGHPRLTENEIETKIELKKLSVIDTQMNYKGPLYDKRHIKRLKVRKKETDKLFGPIREAILKKTP